MINFFMDGIFMQTLDALSQSADLKLLLQSITSIAIVGLSPKKDRPSNMVGRYLLEAGYTIYPVNPGQTEILGETCYPDLASVPHNIDIVDIFRRSEDILPIVEKALELRPLPKTIWMQQGIVNNDAAELARKNGLSVIMDRCIKVDHFNLVLSK